MRRLLGQRGRHLPTAHLDTRELVLRPPLTTIQGWALAEPDLDRIEVVVGNGEPIRARPLALRRPDVAAAHRSPSAPICGWEAIVPIPPEAQGRQLQLAASAVHDAGVRPIGKAVATVGESFAREDIEPRRTAALRARANAAAFRQAPRDGALNLLAVTHRLDIGGAQLFLQNLLRTLVRGPSTRCTVLSPADGPLREELERMGIAVHVVAPLGSDAIVYESRMRELVLLGASLNPDVVLANTSLAFWGVDLATRLEVPVLWAIHESFPVDLQPFGPLPRYDEHIRGRFLEALRTADRIAFPSEATRDLYLGHGDEERLIRVDYGIPLTEIDAERRLLDRDRLRFELGYARDEVVIACVGTIEARKCQAALVVAFARLAAQMPNARLVLVGDLPSDYSLGVHESLARMPEVASRVRIVPLTARPELWFEAADAFALPSDVEALPLAVLEAMAFELPVLAADAFGPAELIEDGVSGVLCEPRSLTSLTSSLRRLLALPRSERRRIGRAGRDIVRTAHRLESSAGAYRELLLALASRDRLRIQAPV